ncbi:MAG: SagB/ThcOx family dehydrogenase [Actinomycetota bacterium]
MNDGVSAIRLHESTKHGTPPASPERLVEYQRLDPRNAPRPFKEYTGLERLDLPRRVVPSSLPGADVLSGVTGNEAPLDPEMVATLLFLSAGVTRMMSRHGRRIYFRAAMSAGNLHPVEIYVVVGDAETGIEPGIHHFSPLDFALTRLRRGDLRGRLGVGAPVAFVLTGIPWRTTWKYGERGWRHLYWDGGTIVANLTAVADAHGLDHRTLLGFDDEAASELLGVDGVEEMPLAVVELGPSGEPPPLPPNTLEPLHPDVSPVAPRPIRLPLLEEAQAASTLDGAEVAAWREAGREAAAPAPARVGHEVEPEDPIEAVILRRGSTRRMLPREVPGDHLRWPLAAATRRTGIDAAGGGTLLHHYLTVHAVEGLQPGRYRYAGGELQMLGTTDSIRRRSAALCLGQALGGDSAYTVFHSADLASVIDALGSRGYRMAQLEAGIVSGRLSLCAFTLGLGATGLTFFDDPVSDFFETEAAPMLVTSVGTVATPPAPSGSPGRPATLGA